MRMLRYDVGGGRGTTLSVGVALVPGNVVCDTDCMCPI